MKPKIAIVDLDGIETIREMNDEEFAQYEKDMAELKPIWEAQAAEAAAKEAARQALLDKLGITADEAKLLLG